MTKLSDYLAVQLEDRGWSMRELGRRTGYSHPYISAIVSGQRTNPSADFCIALARAFNERPEDILRLAGILPSEPPAVIEETEALNLLRRLTGQARNLAMATLRALAGRERTPLSASATIREENQPYTVPPEDKPKTLSERMAYHLAKELEQLTTEDQQRVLDLMDRLSRRDRPGITSDTAPHPGS